MTYGEVFTVELISYLPKFLGSLILFGLGMLIGKRLTHYWNYRKARREFSLEASKCFQFLYGEFFEIRREWKYYHRKGGVGFPSDYWCQILERACAAEGKLEALFLQVACESELSEEDINNLGVFRQGYQILRESIADNKAIEWGYSEHPEYKIFKELSANFNSILVKESISPPTAELAAEQIKKITSNEQEELMEKVCKNP